MNSISVLFIYRVMIKNGRYPEVKSKPSVNLEKVVLAKFGKVKLKTFLAVRTIAQWSL